jgi:hypothetical protein
VLFVSDIGSLASRGCAAKQATDFHHEQAGIEIIGWGLSCKRNQIAMRFDQSSAMRGGLCLPDTFCDRGLSQFEHGLKTRSICPRAYSPA